MMNYLHHPSNQTPWKILMTAIPLNLIIFSKKGTIISLLRVIYPNLLQACPETFRNATFKSPIALSDTLRIKLLLLPKSP
jgi:hypothetical protein